MTCTLNFYKLPINLDGKNFVLESINNYLSTFTPLVVSSFQYQRFDLNKTIKVNLSQDYQLDVTAIQKYNYLRIIATDTNNHTTYYYYFIRNAKQLSMGTIEFEIRMDTLNTFQFTTAATGSNNTYNLSPKSLITREHKDRFKNITKTNVLRPCTADELNDITDIIYEGSFMFETESAVFAFPVGTLYERILKYGYVAFYNDLGSTWGIKVNGTLCAGVRFAAGTIELVDENGDDIEFIYWEGLDFDSYLKVQFINLDQTITMDGLDLYTPNLVFFNVQYPEFETALANCIVRQVYAGTANAQRNIDFFQEGVNPLLFKTSEKKLEDFDGGNTWYVAYSSVNAVVSAAGDTQPIYVNPVQVDILCDSAIVFETTSDTTIAVFAIQLPSYADTQEYLVFEKSQFTGTNSVTIGGTTINASSIQWATYDYLLVRRKNNLDIAFADAFFATTNNFGYIYGTRSTAIASAFMSISVHGINSAEIHLGINADNINAVASEIFVIGSSAQTGGTLSVFEEFDLTDPKLIKIINVPYCPVNWINDLMNLTTLDSGYEYNSNWNTLKAKSLQKTRFVRNIEFTEVSSPFLNLQAYFQNITRTLSKSKYYESKLLNSDYNVQKFVYDSFGFYFKLEDINIEKLLQQNTLTPFKVNFKVSSNIQSKFIFQFPQYICRRTTEDYENILIVERNNEKALFNNAYINYVRNGGYSYDTKKATAQNAMNGVTTAFTILGAIGSFASTPITGVKGVVAGVSLATTSVASIIRSIHTAQEQDRAIAQKSLQLQNQGTAVSRSNRINPTWHSP